MIEFKGELSKECRRYMRIRESLAGVIILFLAELVLAYPVIIWLGELLETADAWIIYLIWSVLLLSVTAISNPTQKDLDKVVPKQLIISTQENLIISIASNYRDERYLSAVKCVYDMGSWYLFRFSEGPNHPPRFICQKDHFINGTVEEFEKLFEGKLIKK